MGGRLGRAYLAWPHSGAGHGWWPWASLVSSRHFGAAPRSRAVRASVLRASQLKLVRPLKSAAALVMSAPAATLTSRHASASDAARAPDCPRQSAAAHVGAADR